MINVSASSLKEYSLCPTKWYTRKVLGIEQPKNKGAVYGTRAHALFEAGLRGRAIRNRRVKAALSLVPARSPDHQEWIEGDIPDLKAAGIQVLGRMDFAQRQTAWARVVDLKTAKTPRYALTEETLASDEQAVIYAQAMFTQFPEVELVELLWIYTLSKGRVHAWPVRTSVMRTETAARFALLEPIAAEMGAAYLKPASEIPKSERYGRNSACQRYGGCPYYARCWPPVTVESIWGDK